MADQTYIVVSGGGSALLPHAIASGVPTPTSDTIIVPNPHSMLGPVSWVVSELGDAFGNAQATPTWGLTATSNNLREDFPHWAVTNPTATAGSVGPRINPSSFGCFEVLNTDVHNPLSNMRFKILGGHVYVQVVIPTGGAVSVFGAGSRMFPGILNPDGASVFDFEGNEQVQIKANMPVGNSLQDDLGLEAEVAVATDPPTFTALLPFMTNVDGPNTLHVVIPMTRTKQQYWQEQSGRVLPTGYYSFADGAWPMGNCMSAFLSGQGGIRIVDKVNDSSNRSTIAATYSAHYALLTDSTNPLVMDASIIADDFDDEGVCALAGGIGWSLVSKDDAVAACCRSCIKHAHKRVSAQAVEHATRLIGPDSAPMESLVLGSGQETTGRINSFSLVRPHPTKPGQVETVHGHNVVSRTKAKESSTLDDILSFVKGAAEVANVAGEVAALF